MREEEFIHWNVDTQAYTEAGDIQLNRFCNSVTVRNSGTVNLYVNGDLVEPDTYKSFGGEPRSLFKGTITLKWLVQSPAPATLINMATVTQIFYIQYGLD